MTAPLCRERLVVWRPPLHCWPILQNLSWSDLATISVSQSQSPSISASLSCLSVCLCLSLSLSFCIFSLVCVFLSPSLMGVSLTFYFSLSDCLTSDSGSLFLTYISIHSSTFCHLPFAQSWPSAMQLYLLFLSCCVCGEAPFPVWPTVCNSVSPPVWLPVELTQSFQPSIY